MADILPELPHMSERELEQFLATNSQELKFTPQSVATLKVRRRRRSLEMKSDEQRWNILEDDCEKLLPENAATLLREEAAPLMKLVVLGDDIPAKLKAIQSTFQGNHSATPSGSSPSPSATKAGAAKKNPHYFFDLAVRQFRVPDSGEVVLLQPWVPPTSFVDRHLRQESYEGADCFVVFFSVKDRGSFDSLSQVWIREIQAHLENERLNNRQLTAVPIILVGAEAEIRQAKVGLHGIAVSSTEAVQLAQETGAAKYIETHTDNIYHAEEVFSQAVKATLKARQDAGVPLSLSQQRFFATTSVFLPALKVPAPKGMFDLMSKTFCLAQQPDISHLVTVDGSDPNTSPTAILYTTPLSFDRPFPKVIRVVGKGRCRYPSSETQFAVPRETPAPRGYFDICNKRFVVELSQGDLRTDVRGAVDTFGDAVQIRYTTDGSDPTSKSAIYSEAVMLDSNLGAMLPWGADSAEPPQTIKLVAIGDRMFRSKVVTVEAPSLLPPVKAQYSAFDGILKVETQPNAEYRYTLDGSVPTYTSTLYVRPVMIPKDQYDVKKIRIAAFPKLYFPSRETIIEVAPHFKKDPEPRTIATTRTAVSRMENALQRRRAEESIAEQPPVLVAPGSRHANPVVGSRTNSPRTGGTSPSVSRRTASPMKQTSSSTPAIAEKSRDQSPGDRLAGLVKTITNIRALSPKRRQHHEGMPPPPSTRPVPGTPFETGQSTEAKLFYGTPAALLPPASATPQPNQQAPSASPSLASNTQDNTINFDFDTPISLSHITVATPGSGKGPTGYEVRATKLTRSTSGVIHPESTIVGSGDLDDYEGVQTMHVIPSARVTPITRVQCVFHTKRIGEPFQINDMKIHGKPFKE